MSLSRLAIGGRWQVPENSFRGASKLPARAKVAAYPTQKKYGIVFAFFFDQPEDERPSLYAIPEYYAESWRPSNTIILNVNCYYERSMANGLDPVHNEFVRPAQGFPPMHKETFRTWEAAWGAGFEAYFINMCNFVLDPAMDAKVMEVNLRITSEDIGVLENLHPIRTPDSTTLELMTSSDEIVMKYRSWVLPGVPLISAES